MLDIFHHVPGRLRICLPELRRNPKSAAQVRGELAAIDGVRSVYASTVSGNIIVRYDENRLDPCVLADVLRRDGYVLPPIEFSKLSHCAYPREPRRSLGHDFVVKAAVQATLDWIIGRTAASLLRAII